MNIAFDKKWRIVTIPKNFVLQRRGKKDGESVWEVEGYYSRIESLLEGYKQKHLRSVPIKDLRDLISELAKVNQGIAEVGLKTAHIKPEVA